MEWVDRDPYVEEVTDGVFAFVQPDGSWMINNAGFVVGNSGRSLLVDTSSTQRRTTHFLDEVERRASGSPIALVNTHHHPDHTYGNYLVPPGTPVIAHDLCRTEVLAAGLEATQVITQPDYGDLQLRPPDFTFSSTMTLHVDDQQIELIHVGPAHTSNDLIVSLPEQRCVFAGDVVFAGGQPFLLEGSVAGFSLALARIRALDPAHLVPGHGPVVHGGDVRRLLDDLAEYVDFVAHVAAQGYASGLTPLEAALEHKANPYSEWQESERLVGNLHRAFSETSGAPVDTRLRVPDVWPDMVAFHGGPIETHA